MKILLNILQILLALWIIAGSVYMMGHYETLASTWAYNTLPGTFWIILGIVQIILAVGLLISVKISTCRKYAAFSAVGLAIIVLSGTVLYGAYAGFPGMLWALVPALLFMFLAYTRKKELLTN